MNTTALANSLVGSVVLTDTTASPTGEYYAVQVIADAVVDSVTYHQNHQMTNSWADLTSISAGTVLYGRFTNLTLASGEAILHRSR